MAIPDYQTLMLPLLQLSADGALQNVRESSEKLAQQFGLEDDERVELLPSGSAFLFDSRVGWARTYLKQAGLLEAPRRGFFSITERGKSVLKDRPAKIDVAFLEQFPEFKAFRSRKRDAAAQPSDPVQADFPEQSDQTPEDALANAYLKLRAELAADLLEQVKNNPPAFFERLVVDLLVRMGYGGSRQDAGRAIGRSGDGGIDGVISEDRLGLDVLYIQAKRWDSTVGRPEIQKFAGALQGQRASKGIFITTSSFSKEAEEYAAVISSRIVLINGSRLADLMIDHNVGVASVGRYEIKRVDSDYFDES